VGECKFTDVQQTRVEQVLFIIIDKALTLETSKAADWKDLIIRITWIVATLGQQDDFSDELIVTVESKIAKWIEKWVAPLGRQCMTTYTHCIGVGHAPYFMRKWRNSYQ
jgi:hypothetical protein